MKLRLFPIIVLFFIVLSIACQSKTEPMKKEKAKVLFVKAQDKIDVLFNDKLFTSFVYKQDYTKPVLFPVNSPSGIQVNRSFPFANVEGEKQDHPHHAGLFFTVDKVNGTGFWNTTKIPPQIKFVSLNTMTSDDDKGILSVTHEWTNEKGEVLLQEDRTMEFSGCCNQNIIDFDITLTAVNQKVVFEDTKEGMFAIRVAHWLKEKAGNSYYLSSNGDKGEKNVWGKRASWVALQGKKDSTVVGIAILNHPESINYPTYWHARAYGLFAANPLGQSAFQKTRGEEQVVPYNLTLGPGQKAFFKFRVIIFEGDKSKEELDNNFENYIQTN